MVLTADVSPAEPEDLQRGSRLGQYELLLRIGRGGMATVWVARTGATPDQQRLVAVKAILADLATDQEFTRMFLDEGRIIQMIRHPNVVDVYEAGEHRGIMYIAMEWVEGDSLHAIIAEAGKRRPIPPEMAVRIIADAAAGLHAAHELRDPAGNPMNVVHRDVSPHNILIGVDGSIKLVDFGVAKAIGRVTEATSAGQLKGKFGYMSPEQAMAKKVDRRSDVFALGIVLFELTTGRRLFRGEHDAETLHMVVSGKVPAPTTIDRNYPPALEAIVLKALTRDPAKRFQTAEEFREALDAFLKAERVVVPRAGIANLLKKVLGPRIEQRRKAIRSAVRSIDHPNLVPSSPEAAGFAPVAGEHTTGVSAVTGGVGSSPGTGSGVSGVAAAGQFSDARISAMPPLPGEGSNPSGVSHAAYPIPLPPEGTQGGVPMPAKRGNGALVVGGIVAVLLVLAAVAVAVVVKPWAKTEEATVQPTTASEPASPPPTAKVETTAKPPEVTAPPKPTDDIPAVPVDSLGSAAPPPPPPPIAKPPSGVWKPPAAVTKPPTTAPTTPTPATTTAPPRAKNPYE